MLDQVAGGENYRTALAAQRAKVDDPSLTPAAKILHEMTAREIGFYEFAMGMAEQHENWFARQKLDADIAAKMRDMAGESHRRQREIEAGDTVDFDEFLADYFRRHH